MLASKVLSKVLSLVALSSVIYLVGCASVSVPLASDADDAKAKTFAAPSGKSNIYIYNNETTKTAVIVDGKLMGETAPKTYLLVQVYPGKHTVVAKGEKESTLQVATQADKSYFVSQKGGTLQAVDEAPGKKDVADSKLAASK